MTISQKDGYTVITAADGCYVGKEDNSLYAPAISLGRKTDPATIIEKPIDEWPPIPEPEEPDFENLNPDQL